MGEAALNLTAANDAPASANKDVRNRLTPVQNAQIRALKLANPNQTTREIADVVGCSHVTVADRLKRMGLSVTSKEVLAAHRVELLEDILTAAHVGAAKGDHRPAEAALIHAGELQSLNSQGHTTNIAVLVGDGNAPIGEAPPFALEVSTLTLDMHRPSGDLGSDNQRYVATSEATPSVSVGQQTEPEPATSPPVIAAGDPGKGPGGVALVPMEPEDFTLESGG